LKIWIAAKYWNQIRADQENNKTKAPKQPPKKKELKQDKKEKFGKEIEEEKVPFDSKTTQPLNGNNFGIKRS